MKTDFSIAGHLLLLLTIAPVRAIESQAACSKAVPRIRSIVRAVHDKQKNVGLSAAVMHHGRLVYSEGMGFADVENHVPFTTATRSTAASVTKAFTGTTLAILADSGVIDLDAPIGRYVPEFHPPGSDRITLRLLAAHLGGVRHYRANERTPEFLNRHFDDVKDIVSLVANDTLIDNPGDSYHYSSYGYNLLAAAIQSATHKPFATVVDELLFRPLKLNDTRFDDIRIVIDKRARHYAYNDPWTYAVTTELRRVPEFDYSYNMGGGNIITTAEDLVKFGQVVIRPGRLTRGALSLTQTEKRGAKTATNWGLGWFVNPDSAGHRMIHVNGSFPGTQAALYVYPDDDIAVSVISNTWGVGASSGEMATTLPMAMAEACRAAEHHYVFYGQNREQMRHDSAFLSTTQLEGAQIAYTWRSLEPEQDRYDFSAIEEDLAFLAAHGKKLFVQLQDVSFYNDRVNVPVYLTRDTAYHGGANQQYRDGDSARTIAHGWMARRWDPAVQARLYRLFTALGDRFDGKIAGINLAETSAEFGASEKLFPSGFSAERYRDAIIANIRALKRAFSKSVTLVYGNFMPGEWRPEDDKGYLRAVYDSAKAFGVGVGGPDLLPWRPGQLKGPYPLMRDASRYVPVGIAVQGGNYDEINRATGARISIDELYRFAKDYLNADYIFWYVEEPYYSRDVVSFVRHM